MKNTNICQDTNFMVEHWTKDSSESRFFVGKCKA